MGKKYTILTGITPSGSGEVHIGNYFGVVLPFLEMAKKAERIFFFIADLHALTTVQNKEELKKNIENLVLSYLSFLSLEADFNEVIFYRQSDIPEHCILQTILNNVTPLGLIKRCHAYKDKLQKGVGEEDINMGLFNYPILMAADILLYKPDYIPVGQDQKQHLEITRDIAQRFNKIYGPVFKLPEAYIRPEIAAIIGTDGKRKMSKSLGNYIGIFEKEKIIRKEIMNCYTDPTRIHPTDPGHTEGNPLFIYHRLINENKAEVKDLEERYKKGQVGDVEVKERLFKALIKRFKVYRQKHQELRKNPGKIRKILKEGAEKARLIASQTLKEVREAIGIKNKYSF